MILNYYNLKEIEGVITCSGRLGLLPHPEQVECGVWRNVLLLARHGVTR